MSGVAQAVPPQPGDIYQTDGAQPVDPGGTISCSGDNLWANPRVTIKVHTSGFTSDIDGLVEAVTDVAAEFNRVGGTSAFILDVVTTGEAFDVQRDTTGDPQTIHIGAAYEDQLRAVYGDEWPSPGGFVASAHTLPDDNGCIDSANIGIRDDLVWAFDTPPAVSQSPGILGSAFYNSTGSSAEGGIYIRPILLHELLHAFGVNHSQTTYSFMNYGNYPWANRAAAKMIRPLPADARSLRTFYPSAATTRTEVAALTTWFDAVPADELSADGDPPADQKLLCAPSQGSSWSPDLFGFTCGTGRDGGRSDVCKDDVIRARFALANYSTQDVTVTARMWFSLDDRWDAGDILSPTIRTFEVGKAGSTLSGNTWLVPSLDPFGTSSKVFFPIVRVEASTDQGETVRDWIPLTGLILHLRTCPPEFTSAPTGN